MGIKYLLRLAACGLLVLQAGSAQAVSTQGRAAATVVRETIAILARTPLLFGYILPGSKEGTVTLSPAGKLKTSGKVQIVRGAHQPAMFLIKGQPNRSYTMHAPSSLTFHGKNLFAALQRGKTSALTVKDFTMRSKNLGRESSSGKLNRVGVDTITLGGTLIVPSNVMPGLYSGLVPLTVSY